MIFVTFNRPKNNIEKKSGSPKVVECKGRKGEVLVRHELHEKVTTKTFTFDSVFGPDSTQMDVYRRVVQPVIQEVLLGYNCTIFA